MADTPGLAVLARELRHGDRDLLSYLDQVAERFGVREPEVLAFLPEEGRFDRLRREAQALLGQYPDPAQRPPLFGVPVGVKDIFHVDGFPTRAGSQVPAEELAGPEALSVTALKDAGALILGKTVTTQFAYFAPGPTRNPYHRDHTPGGSSSGSAAAVSADMCPLALGTQTIGSISRPASFCGVVGFKPTYDRIPRDGVIPLSPSLDHVGFFTPDVAGARLVAGLLCHDFEPVSPPRRPVLGIPEGPLGERIHPGEIEPFRRAHWRLREAGYEVRAVPAMSDFWRIEKRHQLIVAAEAARVHERWYARYRDTYHPKTAELIERGGTISDWELEQALPGREILRQQLTDLMNQHQIDLWISSAATGGAPAGLDSTGDPVMSLPWTQAGLPTLAVPAEFNFRGLPIGLQLAARWQHDEALLAWGEDIEEVLR